MIDSEESPNTVKAIASSFPATDIVDGAHKVLSIFNTMTRKILPQESDGLLV